MSRKLKSEYEADFYAWTMHTAKLIREHKISEIDFENVAEEIESVGNSQKLELLNRLAVLLMHLLKWQYQSERRGNSWRRTIIEQRLSLEDVLDGSPSLRFELDQRINRAYEKALVMMAKETGLGKKILPKSCPYPLEKIFDRDFLPE